MKCFLTCLCVLLCFAPRASAQSAQITTAIDSLPLQEIENFAKENSIDLNVRDFIGQLTSGEFGLDAQKFAAVIGDYIGSVFADMRALMCTLMAPAVLSAVLKQFLKGSHTAAKAGQSVCVLAAGATLCGYFMTLTEEVKAMIASLCTFSQMFFPILGGLVCACGLAMTGEGVMAWAVFAADAMNNYVSTWGLFLCTAASVIAVGASIGGYIRLDGLFGFIKGLVNWSAGVFMTLFSGYLAVQNTLRRSFDGAAVKTAKYTVDNFLPVIGGEVADSVDALAGGMGLVKNALGTTGAFLLTFVCARVLVKLVLALMAMKLSGALMETLAPESISQMTQRFSQVAQMLLVTASVCVVMLVSLIGLCLAGATNVG